MPVQEIYKRDNQLKFDFLRDDYLYLMRASKAQQHANPLTMSRNEHRRQLKLFFRKADE